MYRLTNTNGVIRLADGVVIPLPPQEREGFRYQRWLDEGNEPLPYEPPDTFDADLKAMLSAFREWRRNTLVVGGNILATARIKAARGQATAQDVKDIEDALLACEACLTGAPQHPDVKAAVAARDLQAVKAAMDAQWQACKLALPGYAVTAFAKVDK